MTLRGKLAGFRAAKHTYVCRKCIAAVAKAGCGVKAHGKPQHCASAKEAKRFLALLWQERAGVVRRVEAQPRFHLDVHGCRIGTYTADFRYQEMRGPYWQTVVEDCKGSKRFQDSASALRRRLAEVLHQIVVRIV